MTKEFSEYNRARRESKQIKTFSVEVAAEDLKKLDDKLAREGKTRSRWFRVVVSDYIANNTQITDEP